MLTRIMMVLCALYWLLGMHFFMHNPGGLGSICRLTHGDGYLPRWQLGWGCGK